ncbi:MAG: hypothetical protein WCU88_10425 [Elusimicrobiota bacterium]|jgi:hypothetical protein
MGNDISSTPEPRISRVKKALPWIAAAVAASAIAGILIHETYWAVKQRRAWHRQIVTQEAEARALALSYDAIKLAPNAFQNRLVLWRVGYHTATTDCYHEGEWDKPIVFSLYETEIPNNSHKGMTFFQALARIESVDSAGVHAELLASR